MINVIATEATVSGDSDQPGYLAGYGVIDAELVRELADNAARRMVECPAVSPAEALRYQPSAALERWIRCRDLTCRFPGCDRPATICDVDHTVPFNHVNPAAGGLTVPWNLACYCREQVHQGERPVRTRRAPTRLEPPPPPPPDPDDPPF